MLSTTCCMYYKYYSIINILIDSVVYQYVFFIEDKNILMAKSPLAKHNYYNMDAFHVPFSSEAT